jgi:hypothetical protein
MTEDSPEVPPDPVVFYGRPVVFYLAICINCGADAHARPNPMPFGTEADRDRWADGHRSTGHIVKEAVEVRP